MIVKAYKKSPGKRAFRLHITITLVFVLLTLPVTIIFGVITYRSNAQLIADQTERFIAKSLSENTGNSIKLLSPMLNSVRTATTLMRDNSEYFLGESSTDYLQEMVASSDGVYAAYAAFADGSFQQVRRAAPEEIVLGKVVPIGTEYITRFINGKSVNETDGRLIDVFSFQAPWGVKVEEASGAVADDPRTRSVYKNAVALKAAGISDPYTLADAGGLGITVSSPVIVNDQTIGVIAADLTLEAVAQFLSENKTTPNSITLLADDSGRIIAHPEFALGVTKNGKELVPNRLHKLEDQRILTALGERMRNAQDRFKFRAGKDDIEYLALFSPLPKEFNKPWELINIVPTDDFVGEIRRTNRNLLIFSIVAFFVQIALIYLISRMIARPIEQLAREVMDIREFRFDKTKKINSSISEIRYLSDAISLLERALESFTSYVPTVLVKQLMESGQATKLGVESRFLTVLFTDIEGFSTLSEAEPSQQLLTRVSEYFGTVTKAVEREHGTVDKFIGDAVMAFWGAPKVLDNHAYLACVAAVRAQRGMKNLNRDWALQKLPPLKLRVGIHCDAVLVGNIGSTERISYTVMGDGVNVAARLEGVNKEMGTTTCVSHNVYREAGHLLCLRPIDTVTVKGRKGELLVYELLGIRDGDAEVAATMEEIELCEMTTDAYGKFVQGNFAQAVGAYDQVLAKFPQDSVAQRMLEKSRAALTGLQLD